MTNISKNAGTIKLKGLVDIERTDGSQETDVDITNQGEWSSNQDWASVDNTGLVTYEQNTSEQRTAIITLKYKGLSDTENLIQESGVATIEYYNNYRLVQHENSSHNIESIPAAGGSVRLKCIANAHYSDESVIEDVDVSMNGVWENDNTEICTSNGNGTFTLIENTTYEQRSIKCMFTPTGSSKLFLTITQNAAEHVTIVGYKDLVLSQSEDSPNPIDNVPVEGGDIKISGKATAILSNGHEQANTDITSLIKFVSSTSAYCFKGVDEVTATWQENTTSEDRSSQLNYCLDGYELVTAKITTTQNGTTVLSVEPTSLEFESSGGTDNINITSNTSWITE